MGSIIMPKCSKEEKNNFFGAYHQERDSTLQLEDSALLLFRLDDRIQQRQLLAGGAVQRFQPLVHGCRMDIGYPACQFLFSCFGLGVMYDHMDRGHFSDSGHLPHS